METTACPPCLCPPLPDKELYQTMSVGLVGRAAACFWFSQIRTPARVGTALADDSNNHAGWRVVFDKGVIVPIA